MNSIGRLNSLQSLIAPSHRLLLVRHKSTLNSVSRNIVELSESTFANYLALQNNQPHKRAEKLFDRILTLTMKSIGISEKTRFSNVEEKWALFRDIILNQYKIQFSPYSLENLSLCTHELLRLAPTQSSVPNGSHVLPSDPHYFTSPNAFYWATHPATFPFSIPVQNEARFHRLLSEYDHPDKGKFTGLNYHRDQLLRTLASTCSDDFIVSALLGAEIVNESTLVHDIGCWNGENIVNFMLMSALKGKNIAGAIGTDINLDAIGIANALAEELELNSDMIQFHQFRAHDQFPYHLAKVVHNNILITAWKLIPTLSRSETESFLRQCVQTLDSYPGKLLFTVAVQNGSLYHQNEEFAFNTEKKNTILHPPVFKHSFQEGTTFTTLYPDILPSHLRSKPRNELIINTYYNPEALMALAWNCGLKVEAFREIDSNGQNSYLALLCQNRN